MNGVNILKNKIKRLGEIANIRSGYHFRKSLDRIGGKGINVIQAKDISSENIVNFSNLSSVDNSDYKKHFFIKKGDILLSSRGKFRAGMVVRNIQNTIASTSIYIISPNYKDILSEYLIVYLNSIKGQKLINKNVSGAYIKTILRKSLEDIEVFIPDISTQEQVIEIFKNAQSQEELLEEKKVLTKRIAQGAINKLITNQI